MATVVALYKKLTASRPLPVIVTMPPLLVRQWRRWLEKIVDRRTGRPLSVCEYKGTPKYRYGLNLNRDFLLMSMPVFKNDYDRLYKVFEHEPLVMIVDEAASIKNPGTDNHRLTRNFMEGKELLLLDGAPLSKPGDAYAYVKLISPQVYRNQKHFEAIHVGARDFFGNVTRWQELEFLHENLMLNSVRILKEFALPNLGRPIYDPVFYQLDDDHQALYDKLAEEQILLLENGGKIDATTETKLYNALQQIICNPGHFSGNPEMRSMAHEHLDLTLDQLQCDDVENGKKLIVSANYRMTNRGLVNYLKPYGVAAIFGEISDKEKQRAKERFVDDSACRVLVIQPTSAGAGTDGLQHVCSHEHFMECPIIPRQFTQVVGRIYRDGQVAPAWVRIPVAEKTIQVRLHNNLLTTDKLVNQVQGSFQDLRDAIYGGADAEAQ